MTEDRFAKVNQLLERTNRVCEAWYARNRDIARPEILAAYWTKVDRYAQAIDLYLQVEIPWDSQLIETVGRVGATKFRTHMISCDDSVMDRARDLFIFTADILSLDIKDHI